MSIIRVVVAEDSLTMRRHLVDALRASPGFDVVGEATDGREAIELCQRLRPDVITLDMMMPVMSGHAATEYIMAHVPTPILVVSSSTNRGELFRTYDALSAGAVDVLEKPRGDASDAGWEEKFRRAVRLVSRIKVITHLRGRPAFQANAGPSGTLVELSTRHNVLPAERPGAPKFDCVAMGVSTGGPAALVSLLGTLPPDFPLPIYLVLHIGPPFGAAMAEWLDGFSKLRVNWARDGEALKRRGESCVVMAPEDVHLVLESTGLRLSGAPLRHSCRPSVDTLFDSVARVCGPRAVGVLLTGMGSDGAAGLLAMRQAGARTIAQDEATSVVYGMPREAARLGAAASILPLPHIAGALLDAAAERG